MQLRCMMRACRLSLSLQAPRHLVVRTPGFITGLHHLHLAFCLHHTPGVHADASECSQHMPTLLPVLCCVCAEIGELLVHRVIAQFKRAYKRNDKPITIAAAKFLAHLINQGVLHEVRAGQPVSCSLWFCELARRFGYSLTYHGCIARVVALCSILFWRT